MGRMIKVVLTVIALSLVLLVPVEASASTIYTEGTLYYTIQDGSITITGCFGKDELVTVPSMIAGIPVNSIGKGAFADNENVKTVILPDTITFIAEGAFSRGITVIYNSNVVEVNSDTEVIQSPVGSEASGEDTTNTVAQGYTVSTDSTVSTDNTVSTDSTLSVIVATAFDEADVILEEEPSVANGSEEKTVELSNTDISKENDTIVYGQEAPEKAAQQTTDKGETSLSAGRTKIFFIIGGGVIVVIGIVLFVESKKKRHTH